MIFVIWLVQMFSQSELTRVESVGDVGIDPVRLQVGRREVLQVGLAGVEDRLVDRELRGPGDPLLQDLGLVVGHPLETAVVRVVGLRRVVSGAVLGEGLARSSGGR